MINPETHSAPFKDLKGTEYFGSHSEVYETSKSPNHIVKQVYRDTTGKHMDDLSREHLLQEAKDVQNFISDTEATTFMPKTQVVLGVNEKSEETIFFLAEKIEGRNLKTIELSENDKLEIQNIVQYMVNYYKAHYNGRSARVPEFCKNENYMKGINLANNQGERVYFIDNYPLHTLTPDELIVKIGVLADQIQSSNELFNDSILILKSLS